MHNYQSSFSSTAATSNGSFGYVGMPTAVKRDYDSGSSATEDEFKAHAKQFKRSQVKSKIIKKLIIIGIILGVIILALGAIGLVLNNRYAGRALPYSYIGDISIGGLTADEIKAALDKKADKTVITFTEGGLTRYVKPSEFSTSFDTEKAAQNAIVGFNPFNYLTKRNFNVPVSLAENELDGYIRLHVADKQTNSLDAEIIKQGKELAIKPERYGFRTSTAYVAAELKKQLAQMKNPVVSLSAAYEQPKTTQEDLKDDMELAKNMISTDVALRVWSTKLSPKPEDKIDWLSIRKTEDNGVILEFDQAKVREYVFTMAEKYSIDKEDEMIAVTENGSQYIKEGKKGQKVKNIDKVASDFYDALTAGKNGLFAFEFEYTEYAKIDRQSVNLITVAEEPDSGDTAADDKEQNTTDQTNNSQVSLTSSTPNNNSRNNR